MANYISSTGIADANLTPGGDEKPTILPVSFNNAGRYRDAQLQSINTPQIVDLGDGSKYDIGILAGQNVQDYRSENQSSATQWGSGLLRLPLTAGTKLMEGLGYIGGLVDAADANTEEEAMNNITDNAWVNTFKHLEETIKENIPIYKTREFEEGSVWKQMGNPEFWTDDVVDGLAFMASAYGPGLALKGVGLGAKTASLFANGLKAAKIGKYVESGINIEKLAQGIDLAATTALATTSEAGFEARDSRDQVLNSLKEIDPNTGEFTGKYKLSNGKEITEAEAKTAAGHAAAGTYKGNLFALALSNAYEAKMLLGVFNTGRRAAIVAAEAAGKKIIPMTAKQKAGDFLLGALKTSAVEGAWEENIQLAIQNYEKANAKGDASDDKYKDIFNNWLSNFTTKEGQKNIMLGAIVGLIPGGIGHVSESNANNKKAIALQEAINYGKSFNLSYLNDFYKREADGKKLYINNQGKPELDPNKVDANRRAYEGAIYNQILQGRALEQNDKVYHDYLQKGRLSSMIYNYVGDEQGMELFDTDVEFTAKRDLPTINETRKSLGQTPLTEADLIGSYKAQAREFKKVYDSIENRDIFLSKLKNDKVGLQLKRDLKWNLYREATNQINLSNAIAEIKGEIAQLGTPAKNSVMDNELNDAVARLKAFEDLYIQSTERYALYNSPAHRANLKVELEKIEVKQQELHAKKQANEREVSFRPELEKAITVDTLDKDGKFDTKELIKQAEKKGVKNAKAIIDAHLVEVQKEWNKKNYEKLHPEETASEKDKPISGETVVAPPANTKVEPTVVANVTPVVNPVKPVESEILTINGQTYTVYDKLTHKTLGDYTIASILKKDGAITISVTKGELTLTSVISKWDYSKFESMIAKGDLYKTGTTPTVTDTKVIETKLDKLIKDLTNLLTSPYKEFFKYNTDDFSKIQKDPIKAKRELKEIEKEVKDDFATYQTLEDYAHGLDGVLEYAYGSTPGGYHSLYGKYYINKVIDLLLAKNGVVMTTTDSGSSTGTNASLSSTGEKADTRVFVPSTYNTTIVVNNIFTETNPIGINLLLSTFEFNTKKDEDGNLILSDNQIALYKALFNLKEGSIIEASVDEKEITTKDGKIYSTRDSDKELNETTIPIKLTIPGTEGNFNINRTKYLQEEIDIADTLLSVDNKLKLFHDALIEFSNNNRKVKAELKDKQNFLWKWFGEKGIFTLDTNNPLYSTKYLGSLDETAINKLIKHQYKLFTFNNTEGKATEAELKINITNWKHRQEADLKNSEELCKVIWDKYKQDPNNTTTDVTINKLTHGNFANTKTLHKVVDTFGVGKNIMEKLDSIKIGTVSSKNYEDTTNLYDIETGEHLFTDGKNTFYPGQFYVIVDGKNTFNGDKFPVLLQRTTWKFDDVEFPRIVELVQQLMSAYRNGATVLSTSSTKNELNQYINVTDGSSNSKEFATWGPNMTASKRAGNVITIVGADSIEYQIFVHSQDGKPLKGDSYIVKVTDKDGNISIVNKTIEQLMEGKFKNVVIKTPVAQQEGNPQKGILKDSDEKTLILLGNPAKGIAPRLMANTAKVLDESGKEVGMVSPIGQYALTINVKYSKDDYQFETTPKVEVVSEVNTNEIQDHVNNPEIVIESPIVTEELASSPVEEEDAYITDLLAASNSFSLVVENDTTSYYQSKGNKYERQTEFVGRLTSKDTLNENMKRGAILGNIYDLIGKDIFEGNAIKSFEEYVALGKAKQPHDYTFNLNTDTFASIVSTIQSIKDSMPGYKFYTGVVVSKEYNAEEKEKSGYFGIAGEIDILAVAPNGDKHIIDIKNKKLADTRFIANNLFVGNETIPSSVYTWSKQQSVYADLIPFDVTSTNILHIGTDYRVEDNTYQFGNITTVSKVVAIPSEYQNDISSLLIKLPIDTEIVKAIANATEVIFYDPITGDRIIADNSIGIGVGYSQYGIVQSIDVKPYEDQYFQDSLGVNSTTPNGTIIDFDRVIAFVEKFGTELDIEFLTILKKLNKDITIVVDNVETKDNGKTIVSYFDPIRRTIGINLDYFLRSDIKDFKKEFAHSFSHENLHILTLGALGKLSVDSLGNLTVTSPTQFYNAINELYQIAKQSISTKDLGVTNIFEYLAESISNPAFINKLKNIPYKDENLSIWAKFLTYIQQLFNKILGNPNVENLFDKTLNLVRNEVNTTTELKYDIIGDNIRVNMTRELTPADYNLAEGFTTAEEQNAAINRVAGDILSIYDMDSKKPVEARLTKKKIHDGVEDDFKTLLIKALTVHKAAQQTELNKNPNDIVYSTAVKFYATLINNLEKDTTEKSIYNKVKQYIKTVFDLKITDALELEEILNEQDENRQSLTRSWSAESAFEKSTNSQFNKTTKLTIAKLKAKTLNGQGLVVDDKNVFSNQANYVNYQEYLYKLKSVLTGMTSKAEMMDRLTAMSKDFPSITTLVTQLNDEHLQESFFTDFNHNHLNKNVYLVTIDSKQNVFIKPTIEHKDHSLFISDGWINNLKYKVKNKVITKDTLKIISTKTAELESIINTDIRKGISAIHTTLGLLGINIGMEYINSNIQKRRGESNKPLSEIVKDEYVANLNRIVDNINKSIDAKDNSFVSTSYGNFNALASHYAEFTLELIEPSSPNVHGDLVYGYTLPNWIGSFLHKAKSKYEATQKEFLKEMQLFASTPEGKASNLVWTNKELGIEGFLEPYVTIEDVDGYPVKTAHYEDNLDKATLNKKFIANFDVFSLSGIKNRTNGEGITYTEATDLDYRAYTLMAYFYDRSDKDKEYVNIPSLILADSPQSYGYRVKRIPLGNGDLVNDVLSRESKLYKVIERIVEQEINRFEDAQNLLYKDGKLKSIDTLKAEGVYSHLLENFHYKVIKGEMVFEENGKPVGNAFKFHHIPTLNDATFIDTKTGLIGDKTVRKQQEVTTKNLVDKFLTEFMIEGYKWYNVAEFKKIFEQQLDNVGNVRSGNKYLEGVVEMLLNQLIYNVEQQNLFLGTSAEFINSLDVIKRAKSISATGRQSMTEGTSRVAVIDDIKVKSIMYDAYTKMIHNNIVSRGFGKDTKNYRALMDEALVEYSKINIADGQGWITENAWITRKLADGGYQDIKDMITTYRVKTKYGVKTKYKFKEGQDYRTTNIVPQTSKPFISDRTYDSTIKRMVKLQWKLSEAYLNKEDIKGTDLEIIDNYLDEIDADELVVKSAQKEGLNPLVSLSKGGLIENHSLLGEVNVVTYNNSARREQLQVPDHIIDAENKFAVQIRKHILSNINDSNLYWYNNEQIRGDKLIELYNNLIAQNIQESADKLLSRFVDANRTSIDKTAVSDLLIEQLTDRNTNEGAKAFIRYDEEAQDFAMPFTFTGNRKLIMSVLTSLFTKNINNQKFPGGHVVLVSDAFRGSFGQTPSYKGLSEFAKDKDIKDTPRLGHHTEIINGQETFVVECMLPAYSEKFFNKDGSLVDFAVIPDELKRIIGYRIPTSGKHSSMILKIVKFLPKSMGSNIIVADDIVAQMGSDFDVDSLFMMMPSFTKSKREVNVNEILELQLGAVTNEIYDRVPQFKEILDRLSENDLRNQILQGYARANENWETSQPIDKTIKQVIDKLNKENIALVHGFDSFEVNTIDSPIFTYDKLSEDNNTKDSRNNAILELMLAVLGNDAHALEKIRPALFLNSKNLVSELSKKVEGEENTEVNPVNPITQIKLRNKAINGKQVLPIAANWNTGLALLQTVRAKFVKVELTEEQKAKLEEENEEDKEVTPISSGIVRHYSPVDEVRFNSGLKVTDKGYSEAIDKSRKYLDKFLKNSYGEENVRYDDKTDKFIVDHVNIGWNNAVKGIFTFHNQYGQLYTDLVGEQVDNAADTLKGALIPNLNEYTFNVFSTIVATTGDLRYAAYFINQPSIRRLVIENKRKNGIFQKDTVGEIYSTGKVFETKLFELLVKNNLVNTKDDFVEKLLLSIKEHKNLRYKGGEDTTKFINIINAAITDYNTKFKEDKNFNKVNKTYDKKNISYLSLGELNDGIRMGKKAEDLGSMINHYLTQLSLLNTWQDYDEKARYVSDTIIASNSDKIGTSPSLEVSRDLEDTIKKVSTYPIISDTDMEKRNIATAIYGANSVFPMLKAFYENSNMNATKYISPLFSTESKLFRQFVNQFKDNARHGSKSRRSYYVGKLENYMVQHLLYNHPTFNLDTDEQKRILGINLGENQLSTAMKIEYYKSAMGIKPNAVHILNSITGDFSDSGVRLNGIHKIIHNDIRNNVLIEQELQDSVLTMYFKGTTEQKDFIKELIQYSYLTTALSYGRGSFINLIPFLVLEDLGIPSYLRNVEREIQEQSNQLGNDKFEQTLIPNSIVDKFILGNTDLNWLVPTVSFAKNDKGYHTNWNLSKKDDTLIISKKNLGYELKVIKEAKYIKKYFEDDSNADSKEYYYIVYEKTGYEEEAKVWTYIPVGRYNFKTNTVEPFNNTTSIFEKNETVAKAVNTTQAKTITKGNYDIVPSELLEDYSQTTGQTIGTSIVSSANNLSDLIGKEFSGEVYDQKGTYILKSATTKDIKHTSGKTTHIYERDYITVENKFTNKVSSYYGTYNNGTFYATETSDGKRISTASNINFTLVKTTSPTGTQSKLFNDNDVTSFKGNIQTNIISNLVVQGKATSTIRNANYHKEFYKGDGIYQMSNGVLVNITFDGIANKKGNSITIKGANPKVLSLDEFGKNEGFDNWKGFLKDQKYSDNFITEAASRHYYTISVVDLTKLPTKLEGKISVEEWNKLTIADRNNKIKCL